MHTQEFSSHLQIRDVIIDDPFWNEIVKRVRQKVLPYQYQALSDCVDGAEKSHCIENFLKAKSVNARRKAGLPVKKYPVDKWQYTEENTDKNAFLGWVFQDSDVYKWLEAVGYFLQGYRDSALESKADAFIRAICDAQMDNGYLDTLYIINDIDKAFTNLRDHHELYCFGHLAEAALSIYRATKDDRLLNAAYRFADLICETFCHSKKRGYDGHEIAEMALVKLYRESGNLAYLHTAKFMIEERGKQPYYFDIEHGKHTDGTAYRYNQAHCQPKHQKEAVGHAVRGVYLYSAMADLAKECKDTELECACKSIWSNIVNKKLYITGGIGATVHGEAFSFDYDLPNDLAYAETCASIGLIFFAQRMSELEIRANYADVLERALYNTVLSGMSADGNAFFYVNPLEVLPQASKEDSRKQHIRPVRQKWFSCACCPPNLARLIGSLQKYIYTVNSSTVFLHQFICGKADFSYGELQLTKQGTQFCIKIRAQKECALAVRIPEWCNNFDINCKYTVKNGYAFIEIRHSAEITLDLHMQPRLVKCSNRVRANVGKVAVMRGPVVYCLEEADNGKDLQMLKLDSTQPLEYRDGCIYAQGIREKADESLYSTYSERAFTKCTLKFVPYYTWGNRGENEMCVYVRVE